MLTLPERQQVASAASLLQVARALAADSRGWQGVLQFDQGKRWYQQLGVQDDHEAWLLSWLPGQGTGWHDHGGSAGVFVIASGTLHEDTTWHGGRVATRVLTAGQHRAFGRQHVHNVRNVSSQPAVSVHVYSPRLTVMNRYELSDERLIHLRSDRADGGW